MIRSLPKAMAVTALLAQCLPAQGTQFGAKSEDKANLLFVLLTPAAAPRTQVRLLSRIASLRESDYVWERLQSAESAAEVIDAMRSGEEMAVS